MLSKARDVLPLPETPVMTVVLFIGISTSIFFKLCVFSPLNIRLDGLLGFTLVLMGIFELIYQSESAFPV